MKKLFNNIFKTIGFTLLLILVIGLVNFSILATPQKMFPNSLDMGRYKIYADIPISVDIIQKIIESEEKISQSEIFDSSFAVNIFICKNSDLYSMFPWLTGMGTLSSGLTISAVNNIFLNLTRIEQLQIFSDPRIEYSHLNGEFRQILAHEFTHQIITDRIGFWEARKFPRWKTEGYCEYNSTITNIRTDSNYKFIERCTDYFEKGLYGANQHSKFYYKSQIMVEYLFEIEGINFDEFASAKIDINNTMRKLKKWYELNG
jgi:hypothetical protein